MGIDLIGLVDAAAGRRVVVLGDTILDVYIRGVTRGLCRESPAPVVAVQSTGSAPGGAANTAVNVAALGGVATLVSVIGDDPAGHEVTTALRRRGLSTDRLVIAEGRETIAKRRVVVGSQTLVRLDEGTVSPLDAVAAAEVHRHLVASATAADVLVVSDNAYGTLAGLSAADLAEARRCVPIAVVDARNPESFAGLRPSAVTPNYAEAVRLLRVPALDDERERTRQIRELGSELLGITAAELVVVTLGAAGAVLFEPGRPPFHSRVPERTDQEVIGAGDVFTAALALALSAGADPPLAVELATLAAGTAAAQVNGTAVCTRQDLVTRLRADDKLLAPEDVAAWARRVHRQGRRIVFTNGCFDLVHDGHVAFLSEAKALGDVLIVGVNDDESVRHLKGPGRPVVDLPGRLTLLAALSCVDHVVPFSGPSPVSLIETIRPHVFAKGGDYTPETIPEADVARGVGAEIEILTYLPDRSTSQIIERVRAW